MLPEPLAISAQVIRVLESLGVPYMLGGSLASALYGVSRSTLDADIIADLKLEDIDPFVMALQDSFYVDAEMIRGAVEHHSSFNLIHLESMFKVDIFILKQRPFEQNQITRRFEQVVWQDPEKKFFVTTPEDIILVKLEWYLMGGKVSDRQWRDIIGVLRVQSGRLDMDYLLMWSEILGVRDLLQQAIQESQP